MKQGLNNATKQSIPLFFNNFTATELLNKTNLIIIEESYQRLSQILTAQGYNEQSINHIIIA
tara:strand:+ start:730 stop:915 length:186 start_codon:yes stop_codon:yes gene_type:complete